MSLLAKPACQDALLATETKHCLRSFNSVGEALKLFLHAVSHQRDGMGTKVDSSFSLERITVENLQHDDDLAQRPVIGESTPLNILPTVSR